MITEQGSKGGSSNESLKWKNQMSNNFYECLEQLYIDKLNNDLNAALNSNSVDKSDIDSMSARLSSMFVSGAKDCNMILSAKKHVPTGSNKKLNNKWFDVKCTDARKSYHRAKRVYSNIQSTDNMSCLKKSSKHYKKVIRHSVDKYKTSFNNKLRVLRLSNSKDYWKILCSNDKLMYSQTFSRS